MLRVLGMALAALLSFGVLLEVMLRALPVPTPALSGFHGDPFIRTYPPGHQWWVATGWDLRNARQLRANNEGWVASRDFVADDHAVALIGDSFVEASMLREEDRFAPQLEKALGALGPARAVYAMGNPGTSLLDYAERVRFAAGRYGVADFVLLLEVGDVAQALCGSGNVESKCVDARTLQPRTVQAPPSSVFRQMLRHSAAAQYLVGQLKFSTGRIWSAALEQGAPAQGHQVGQKRVTNDDPAPALDEESVRTLVDLFLERTQPHIKGRLVVVLDADRELLRGRRATRAPAERALTIRLLREAGVQVVDAEGPFRAHRARSRLALEVGPYDGHLNGLAFGLLAGPTARTLER